MGQVACLSTTDPSLLTKSLPPQNGGDEFAAYLPQESKANSPSDVKPDVAHRLYNWLSWGPPPSSKCYAALHTCFPGAVPGSVVVKRSISALEPYEMTGENTIYGQSICPDEINNEVGDLATLLQDHWGEGFPMGGISGVPFVGRTGFKAFSHHVPDSGSIFILFGPHIAIANDGEIGKYARLGQNESSSACGAVLAAYNSCSDETDPMDLQQHFERQTSWLDMQQDFLRHKIGERLEEIRSAEQPLGKLASVAYDLVREKVEGIINNDFGPGHLVLLGGIQINMPSPCEDHFQPLMFRVMQKNKAPVDLLPTFSHAQFNGSREVQCSDLFNWLTWAPASNSKCELSLRQHFSGAVPGQVILLRTSLALKRLGVLPENSLYGQSICPDEINNENGDLATCMKTYWGSCFPMGGISGAPFVGRTGFHAFAHHVPDDGNVVILFGPHIAISDAGELGKYLRTGQSECSTACGAVLAAYDACKAGGAKADAEMDTDDMQQVWIQRYIATKLDTIVQAKEPLAVLARVAYDMVLEALLGIVHTNFGKGKLVLIGGVMINMPSPCDDHFQPLMFQVRQEGQDPIDLMPAISEDALFGST